MALTYRSPMEEIVGAFEPAVQSAISSVAANAYREMEEHDFQLFNYALPAIAKERLTKAGIYLSPFSSVPHSHPVCKTLENYLLYKVLPSYIDNRFSFVGIKDFKLSVLKKRNEKKGVKNGNMIEVINRYVTSADKTRYGSEFVVASSKYEPNLQRHAGLCTSAPLKDLIPAVLKRNAKNIFLHDEIHYWSAADLSTFLEVVEPENMLCTLVYPPELLMGSPTSLHKWCYSYEIKGQTLLFYPDGVRSEGYEQPLSGGRLLLTKHIKLKNGVHYCVDVICSKFAHHLVSITRGVAITKKYRSFGPFDAVTAVGLNKISRGVGNCFPISFEIVSRVYRYLRTLKKPDVQSAMAKLGQLLHEPSGAEIKFLEEFAKLVIKTGTINTCIDADSARLFLGRMLNCGPSVFAKQFGAAKEVALDAFVASLEPYSFTIETVELSNTAIGYFEILNDWGCAATIDPCRALEDGMYLPKDYTICRSRAPYVGVLDGANRERRTLLAIEEQTIVRGIATILHKSHSGGSCAGISAGYLIRWITSLLKRVNILAKAILIEVLGDEAMMVRIRKIVASLGRRSALNCKTMRICATEARASASRSAHKNFEVVLRELIVVRASHARGVTVKPEGAARTVDTRAQVEGKNANLTPQAPPTSTVFEVIQSGPHLTCSCRTAMPTTPLPYAGLIHDHFPDQKKNRECAWYSVVPVHYEYNGGSHNSLGWPSWIPKWAEVNDLDISGYDCMLAQKYRKGAGIGLHADDESIFEPHSPILTTNICGTAVFSVAGKCCHGSLLLEGGVSFTMPAGFQESHKHAVADCSAGRISFTFRRLASGARGPVNEGTTISDITEAPQRLDCSLEKAEELLEALPACAPLEVATQPHLSSKSAELVAQVEADMATPPKTLEYLHGSSNVTITPYRIDPGKFIRTSVLGDGNCFWYSLETAVGVSISRQKELTRTYATGPPEFLKRLENQLGDHVMAEEEAISCAAEALKVEINVYDAAQHCLFTYTPTSSYRSAWLYLEDEHFEPARPANDCLIVAISEAVSRPSSDVMHVMEKNLGPDYITELWDGDGVDVSFLPTIFELFGIQALLLTDEGEIRCGAADGVGACFQLRNSHITFLRKEKVVAHKALNTKANLTAVTEESVELLRGCGTLITYQPDQGRALRLAKNLHGGQTGAISSGLYNDKSDLSELVVGSSQAARALNVILGTFGAGKSTLFKKFMHANKGRCITYVSPRRGLAEEFASDMQLDRMRRGKGKSKAECQNWQVCTFEKFLERAMKIRTGSAVIIDEVQLYPPGYLDLVLHLLHEGVHIFLLGDPCQSDYDSEKDRHSFAFELSDICKILENKEYNYNILSRRFVNRNYEKRLPCTLDESKLAIDEQYLLLDRLEEVEALGGEYRKVALVSSFEEKKIVDSYFGPETLCLTFGESTGRNFKYGCILITDVSRHSSERRWITALTRFSHNLCLVNATCTQFEMLNLQYKNRALNYFLTGTSTPDFIKTLLPGTPKSRLGFGEKIGRDEGVKEAKMVGDPWLKTMIDLLQLEDVEEAEVDEEEMQNEQFRTHLPRCEMESVRARWVHKILAKEHREKRVGNLVSEQFTDEHSRNDGEHLTNACERFETIYPRHRANDTVTFLMAVKKRLKFSTPCKEKAKLHEATPYGPFLLKEFLKRVPLKPQHDRELMARAKSDFEEKKTAKSSATIENHSGRSCRDWLADIGLIFSKSQLCTKFDNRFRSAKAAQTIVCFAHSVLCRFAPYMRYIEYKLKESLPPQYYVHSGKKLEELSAWVVDGTFEGVCTESDYEAFDASQDQYIVAFEVALMRYLGLPPDLVNDYIYIKTHLGSKLGNFAIMRFSGEASTFLFNTMANMLFTFLRYELKGSERICFAGDDMCANTRLKLKHEHAGFLGKLKLKAKVQFTDKPTFCGWHLCSDGIYKKPQLVYERMCIAKETNNLHNCIDNYAIEVGYAYRMGERAKERMDEEELEAYYNCVRVIVKNRHLLLSNIAALFHQTDLN
ncbi:replicase polyprotein [Elderberry carlavirus C]|uniref:Replicase polyprotein n=1 Tax=Elderberry carlavirus C TaxID=1569054 RepID=A0A0A7MB61_9VIRU|nr:replicase polyprotein [Elderberry carlavirus C]AIZ76625.1 replicase polyprotein [Elderberry carlavirus C]